MDPTLSYLNILSSPEVKDDYSLDDPIRKRCLESPWHRLFHFKEKLEMDRQVLNAVKNSFQEWYEVNNSHVFDRLWKIIGAPIWTPHLPLNAGTLRSIDQAFQKQLVYWGPGMAPHSEDLRIDTRVAAIAQALFHGQVLAPEVLQQKDVLKGIFIQKNEVLLADFCKAVQAELIHMTSNLPKNGQEEVLWRGFLGNLLALLPFAYPPEGMIFSIPILEKGQCRLVNFKVEVIALSSKDSPITALGFIPIGDDRARPIIAFIGTTYPAGDGFADTLLTDVMPGKSVGGTAFAEGVERLDRWFEGKKEVHAVGASLGGALCFHALLRYHEQLARIDAYNPAGLMRREWVKDYQEGCEICIYNQFGDIVSEVGNFPTGNKVSLYRIITHQFGEQDSFITAHVRMFTGCEQVAIVAENSQITNTKPVRKAYGLLRLCLAPFIIAFTFIGMFFYRIWQIISGAKRQ